MEETSHDALSGFVMNLSPSTTSTIVGSQVQTVVGANCDENVARLEDYEMHHRIENNDGLQDAETGDSDLINNYARSADLTDSGSNCATDLSIANLNLLKSEDLTAKSKKLSSEEQFNPMVARIFSEKFKETGNDINLPQEYNTKSTDLENQMAGTMSSVNDATVFLETPILDEQQHHSHNYQQMTSSSIKNIKIIEDIALVAESDFPEVAASKNMGKRPIEGDGSNGLQEHVSETSSTTEEDILEKEPKNEKNLFDEKIMNINNSSQEHASGDNYDVSSSCYSTNAYVQVEAQSVLPEGCNFDTEQPLEKGTLFKSTALMNKNLLNLNLVEARSQEHQKQIQQQQFNCGDKGDYVESKCVYRNSSTTPTSSRTYNTKFIKSTAKVNIFPTMNHSQTKEKTLLSKSNNAKLQINQTSSSVIVEAATSSNFKGSVLATSALYSKPNSDDGSSWERCHINSTHFNNPKSNKKDCLNNYIQQKQNKEEQLVTLDCRPSTSKIEGLDSVDDTEKLTEVDEHPSTSSARCQFTPVKTMRQVNASAQTNEKYLSRVPHCSSSSSTSSGINLGINKLCRREVTLHLNNNNTYAELKDVQAPASMGVVKDRKEFNADPWADCEENSDIEEICTCNKSTSGSSYSGSNCSLNETEDFEFLAKTDNNDLSNFIQLNSVPNPTSHSHMLSAPSFASLMSTQLQRKRKYNDDRVLDDDCKSAIISSASDVSSHKRIAYDYSPTLRSSQSSNTMLLLPSGIATSSTSSTSDSPSSRRAPRSIIPTRENPPPELQDWLSQFQRWSHAERLLAVDRLIEHCEPTQVRHMMKVIEPQFQRDFISLLPRELALQVLAYLDPMDLLRAAQTCRSWRFLCDDNLLWKEKCRKSQILTEMRSDRPRRGRAGNMPHMASPWKAAYMRQHIIEMNWRSRAIRDPKVLKGHDDHVITCLQFSGNRIVSGSDDNTLKVWSAVTGRCLRTLVGHTGGVWSSQMSGNTIISGSTDRTLKVWDMETGQCVHTLLGHTSTVRCMHLYGKRVVSGSRDATLRVWDIEHGTCLHVLVGHLAAVRCVQYDGKLIVSGAYDYMVKIWHPERQECLHTLQGHTNRVYSLQFDGIHVVSGSLDTSIRVWDVETGNCKHTLMGHQSLTSGMELRQNILVSGNADSTVKVWDITTGQCLQTLSGPNKHQSAVTCLQFNSRFVVTSSDDGTVKLWDVKTGEFIRNLVALDSGGSGGVVWRIRANDTKLICAVGSRNGTEETKLMVLDFDVEGACVKCS